MGENKRGGMLPGIKWFSGFLFLSSLCLPLQRIFLHGKKSNVDKQSVSYGILLQSNVDVQSQLSFA